jgi:hypothetical protein
MKIWRIRHELAYVHAMLFLLRGAGWSEPSHGLCHFLVDRYLRLHEYHQSHGRGERARRFLAKAEKYWFMLSPSEPPPAAALAMPVPLPPLSTWAVSGRSDPEQDRKVA